LPPFELFRLRLRETTAMWNDLLLPGVPYLEKAIRTLAVYFFLLLGLRLAGKRELGQFNPYDLVVLLLLSNTVQNSIIGNDNSLTGGLFGAAVLLAFNYVMVRFLYRHPALDRLAEGDSDVLIENGVLQEKALAQDLITLPELESAARRQGIPSLAEVDEARIEAGGALTFVQKKPTEEQVRHEALVDRLSHLEDQLERIESRLARS
jgi:uncharacterized membrane protein YcaP (DUF421 family)